MKLTIIGAGSPRFPLLLNSLLRKGFAVDEIALYDTDYEKLGLFRRTILEEIISHYSRGTRVQVYQDLEAALRNTDYVFSSIRVGGQEARNIDETVPLEFDTIGQETIGAGGAALALRTIPVAVEQAETIRRVAPEAWVINFTNPAGIISQAVRTLTGHSKIVGICDAPELIGGITARLYGVDHDQIKIDYFGLNHLGWVHTIKVQNREVLTELINKRLDEFIAHEPFYNGLKDWMRSTGLIPNEYLFYYRNLATVLENQKRTAEGRARSIEALDAQLKQRMASLNGRAVEYYNKYIDSRNSTYMKNETGFARAEGPQFSLFEQKEEWGYDTVALSVLQALESGTNRPLILNIPNGSFCPYLEADDFVETSSLIHEDRFVPAGKCPEFPEEIEKLIRQVKKYERTLISAVREKSRNLAVEALKMNPVIEPSKAERLFAVMAERQHRYLHYLK
ncbi:MAG: glycoside hydrolase [Spirochaetaceae bacterium]|nr:glycoside hydrolase [Spirochaetaceae bacterium]MCF7939624.1 glycoside hydrolase [Spirochaetales bacterium]